MYNLIKLISKIPVLPLNIISNKRSFVYIENLIALILNIIENKSSGIFIGGDESSLSTGELSKLIAKKLNKRPIFFSFPDIILAVMKKIKPSIYERLYGSLELDNSTTNKKLNFHPPFSSSYGVEQMVKWYVNS
jgi:UDP-glucose 4-epimerase